MLSGRLSTRPVVVDDRAFLYALYATTREDLALLEEPVREHVLEMQWRAQQAQYEAAWPMLVDQIVLLANISIGHVMTALSANELRIVDISLLPEHRGQGFGAMLLQAVLESAGTLAVRLSVTNTNPAKRLYERMGFVIVGESSTYIEMEWRAA